MSENWGRKERAAFCFNFSNRQRPQARLAAAGLAKSNRCNFCIASLCREAGWDWTQEDTEFAPEIVAAAPAGAPVHRTWKCEAANILRQELAPEAMRSLADEADIVGMAAFEKGFVPSLSPLIPPPSRNGTCVWQVRPPGGTCKGVIYTDGSRLDGPGPRVARNGWSFVVKNDTGRTVASANGTPPSWIDDIPGSAAWAVYMAAVGAEPGCTLRVDCLPCVTAFKAGLEWATVDKRIHARVHELMLTAWGDFDADNMVWMQAHTTEKDVGVKELGNGQKLTTLDRRGNELAVKLSKAGAETHRVPQAIRGKLRAQDGLIESTLK